MSDNTRGSKSSNNSRGVRRSSGGTADWASVSGERIRDAVCAAAFTGGALRFGYSRDGGAYAIGIYGDGEPYTEFVKPSEDIEQFLLDIKVLFEDIRDDLRTKTTAQNARK